MSLEEKVCYCSSLTGVNNSISKFKSKEFFIPLIFLEDLKELKDSSIDGSHIESVFSFSYWDCSCEICNDDTHRRFGLSLEVNNLTNEIKLDDFILVPKSKWKELMK